MIAVAADTGAFVRFCSERFDRSDPAEVVGKLGVQVADHLAHFGIAGSEPLLEEDRTPDNDRHGDGCHPGDAGRGDKKDAHDDHDRGDQPQDCAGAGIQKSFQLIDIVVQDGHQPAGRLVFKIRHPQPLDVAVGVDPKLVLDSLGQVSPQHLIDVLE